MPPLTQTSTSYPPITGLTGNTPALVVLAMVLTVAVYTELKESRIPNWLTLSGMALGLLIAFWHGSDAFWSSLGGLAIGFGFLFIFYVFGGMGGGDVKLMGAAGALMGANLIKPALFYTAVLGAFLAVIIVVWRKDFWLRLARFPALICVWRKEKVKPAPPATVTVPYGLAIAAGCLLALLVQAME